MADDKKKGFLSKLFGAKKSSCCSLKIEEVTDQEERQEPSEPLKNSPCCGPCCGDAPAKQAKE